MRSALLRVVVVVLGGGVAGAVLAPGLAAAALPSVGVNVTTAPLTNTTAHTGVTVTAGCAAGTTLVGGGAYDRVAANPATPPTNGLVMGGTSPSTGSSPVDTLVANGATNPNHWFSIANFTGVADPANQDQAETFALCATGGTQATVVETSSTTGPNATQQVNPPVLTIATCPAGSTLIGGGAITNGAGQVNDGTTVGNSGNLKPMASYPSNVSGVPAADGSTSATSWTAYGASGIPATTDVVTSFALCSTDSSPPPVQVARTDIAGPTAQAGTTITAAGATCPSGTQLLGGGYSVDQTVGATSGLQPQQGWHMRGSFPSTSAVTAFSPTTYPTEVSNGTNDPATWEALMQAGGQSLPAGNAMNLHSYAMCVTSPPPVGPTQVAGTVRNGSGSPLANICVYLYGAGAAGARTGDTGTCTDASGNYAMNVAAAGSYNVAFFDPGGGNVTQWYSGASSEAGATAVNVSAGVVTSGVNATMSGTTEITGTVTNGSGTGLANICVYLYGSGASGARTGDAGTCTDASGNYVMGVAAGGSYNVAFFDPSGAYNTQWYSGAGSEAAATAVSASAGAHTTGVNAVMSGPTPMTGTVTNASGTPLANICVYLYLAGATGARTADTGTCTNASGQYVMNVAAAGSYNVAFFDPSSTYLTQWYNGASSEGTATPVTLTIGTPTPTANATMATVPTGATAHQVARRTGSGSASAGRTVVRSARIRAVAGPRAGTPGRRL